MNCKPNQRAVITRTMGVPALTAFLGTIVVTNYLSWDGPYGPVWAVMPGAFARVDVHIDGIAAVTAGEEIREVADAALTPLPDDPGEGATDEMVQKLGVPGGVTA